MPPLPLTGRDLTIDNVIEVARGRRAVGLDPGPRLTGCAPRAP